MANTQETRPDDWPSWAVTGDKTRPVPDSAISVGFPQTDTPPTRQTFNWAFNQIFKGVRYLLQSGVPDWSANETYGAQATVKRGGLCYIALSGNTNLDPATNPGTWERWAYSLSQMNTAIDARITAGGYATTAYVTSAIAAQQTVQDGRTTAALAPYSTTSQMNTAISNAIATQQTVQDARTQSAIAAQLSQSNVMTGKASRFGVLINDALVANYSGQVFPLQTSHYVGPVAGSGGANAASVLVSATNYGNGATTSPVSDSRNAFFVSPVDGSIYLCSFFDSGNTGLRISKYSAMGALLNFNVIDAGATATSAPNLIPLSNGNVAVVWGRNASTPFFAILDSGLQTLVAATAIGGTSSGGSWSIHAVPLSGGGFAAILSTTTAAPFMFIATNAGAVTYGPTAVSGAGIAATHNRIAQLSSGDIAVAMISSTAAKSIAHAIFSVTGTAVLAYTVLDAATGVGGAQSAVDISVLPGFYCVFAIQASGIYEGFVLNNAGALQGAKFSQSGGTANGAVRVNNDGVKFWAIFPGVASGNLATLASMPTSGTGFVTTQTAQAFIAADMIVERDILTFSVSSNSTVWQLNTNGTATVVSTAVSTSGVGGSSLRAGGDFTIVVLQGTGAPVFGVFRYMDIALLGISRQTVAPNNAGTVVAIAVGPLAAQINPVAGVPSRNYDHTGANIAGNKGTVQNNSLLVKGF